MKKIYAIGCKSNVTNNEFKKLKDVPYFNSYEEAVKKAKELMEEFEGLTLYIQKYESNGECKKVDFKCELQKEFDDTISKWLKESSVDSIQCIIKLIYKYPYLAKNNDELKFLKRGI